MRKILLYTLGWFSGYLLVEGTSAGILVCLAGLGLVLRNGGKEADRRARTEVVWTAAIWLAGGIGCGILLATMRWEGPSVAVGEERLRVEGVAEGVASGSTERVRVRMRDSGGKAWVVTWPAKGVRGSLPLSGDVLVGQGIREVAGAPSNPFEFNMQAFQAGQGLAGTVRLRGGVWRPGAADVSVWERVWCVAGQAREAVGENLDALGLAPDVLGIVRALVLGDSTGLSGAQRGLFSATGTAHLFAVSGLHLVTFGEIVLLLFRLLNRALPDRRGQGNRERWVSLLVLLGGLAYVLLTGAQVSCLRAFVMLLGRCVAAMTGREYDAWTWLAMSSLAICCSRPDAMEEVSFQLSVACVAAMLAAGELARSRGTEGQGGSKVRIPLVSGLWASASTSWASSLVTLPIVWRQFGGIPLLPVPANMVAVPLVSNVMFPLALLGSFVPLPGPLGSWLGWLIEWLVSLMEAWLGGVTAVGGVVHAAWPGWIAASVASGLLFVASFRGSLRARAACLAGAVTVALCTVPVPGDATREGWELVLFHAEEADTALLRSQRGVVLVDGGRKGAGRRLLMPYLWHHGVERLDVVIISHAHDDHFGGLPELVSELEVCEYWVAEGSAAVGVAEGLARIGPGCGGPPRIRSWRAGQEVEFSGFRWRSWWPQESVEGLGQNDSSLVLTAEDARTVLLLPGDIEGKRAREELEETVAALGEQAGDPAGRMRTWVMKAPHHGHRSPLAAWLYKAIAPDVVFLPSEGSLVWWDAFWCGSPCRRPPLLWLSGERGAMRLVREGPDFSIEVQPE